MYCLVNRNHAIDLYRFKYVNNQNSEFTLLRHPILYKQISLTQHLVNGTNANVMNIHVWACRYYCYCHHVCVIMH